MKEIHAKELKLILIELLLTDKDVREAMAIAKRRAEWDRMVSAEEDSSSALLKRLREKAARAFEASQSTPERSGGEDR